MMCLAALGGMSPTDNLGKITGMHKEQKLDFKTRDLNLLAPQESRTIRN